MRKTTFIFAGIISAVIGTAYAVGENTVTSKSYVDTQDALKQDKITAGTTGSVVTYDGEDANGQAQFNERGIYDGLNEYDESTDADKLVTAQALNNLPALETTKLTCANPNDGCTLWTMSAKFALTNGWECALHPDCSYMHQECVSRGATGEVCTNHKCECMFK